MHLLPRINTKRNRFEREVRILLIYKGLWKFNMTLKCIKDCRSRKHEKLFLRKRKDLYYLTMHNWKIYFVFYIKGNIILL